MNLRDISGRGTATAGFDAFFILKLNLFGVCDCGPVGGGRLGSVGCNPLLSAVLFLSVPSACKSLVDLGVSSPSLIWTSPEPWAALGWLWGDAWALV